MPVEFADEHVFVGKELIQSADGYFGAPGDFVEGKGFEPDVDKDRAGAGEDAVEAFAASLLRGASARYEYVRGVLVHAAVIFPVL